MALVAATVMWALRGGMALFPGFASRYPVKKFAAAAALIALTAYLLISGAEVAAQRSFHHAFGDAGGDLLRSLGADHA